ncbi:hypothetical protein RJ640_002744 [Escallonia rubra]|uniref:YchF C-terminal domain-containing protein n=1 Tax=Escallonia rubra TaxID=112253 RepID=A0AA88UWR6_9ASTE|nr:hypothetical protein RJ640_002744 [Escallonia rubra]
MSTLPVNGHSWYGFLKGAAGKVSAKGELVLKERALTTDSPSTFSLREDSGFGSAGAAGKVSAKGELVLKERALTTNSPSTFSLREDSGFGSAELTELPSDERTEYLKSLGVDESGLGNLIRETYSLLGLQTYFTSGEKETKAWTILAGMTAPQAAGVIHSDFEKGFIRAETVSIVGRDVKFPWKNYSGYL